MILTVLQARMSSTRLPGKVLRPLAGAPMILRQIERLRRAQRIGRLTVATSDDRSDDVLAEILEHNGVEVFRGPLHDVLARFRGVVEAAPEAEHVVRLTADCPLADPHVIDTLIESHFEAEADYSSNTLSRRTYPVGLDAEIMRRETLLAAADEAREAYDREHVTPFIINRPDRFRHAFIEQEASEGDVRWTVDRPDDLEFASAVYDALYPHDPEFDSDAVRGFVRANPEWRDHGGDRRL